MERDSAAPPDSGFDPPGDTVSPESSISPAGPPGSAVPPAPPAATTTPAPPAASSPPAPPRTAPGPEGPARRGRGPRPELVELQEPVYRETGGYRLKLEPPDLARLRELPGSKGKSDRELGAEFLEAHAGRLTAALAGDVPAPAEIRVVVDPFSRQAFLALENKIRGIVSF